MPRSTDLIKGDLAGKVTDSRSELLYKYVCLHPWTNAALSIGQGSLFFFFCTGRWWKHRLKVEKCLLSARPSKEHLHYTLPGLGNIVEDSTGKKKMWEPDDRKKGHKRLSSSQDTAMAHTTPSSCDLHRAGTRLDPSTFSHGWREGSWSPAPPRRATRSWRMLGNRKSLSSVVWPRVTHPLPPCPCWCPD